MTRIFILILMGMFSNAIAQQKTTLQLSLTGSVNGDYTFDKMDYGRINNSKLRLPPEATLGLFSVPISKVGNLEVAAVIANATGMPLEVGSYTMVKVENENPVLQQLPKQGFMTLVALRNEIASEEYYTTSGNIEVTEVSASTLKATFDVVMETSDGGKSVTAKGGFVVVF